LPSVRTRSVNYEAINNTSFVWLFFFIKNSSFIPTEFLHTVAVHRSAVWVTLAHTTSLSPY